MSSEVVAPTGGSALVVRSSVPPNRSYNDYKPWLRIDFFYCCAYCSMSEAEAQALRFTIDHYEPKSMRPELTHAYDNLMYCCDECNTRKGDRCPPSEARAQGVRFFRPDIDVRAEHFKVNGYLLESRTNTGEFSIEAIDLNRKTLRTLRELRERLSRCDAYIAEGISVLRRFHIDQLPPHIRAKALKYINQTIEMQNDLVNAIDHILTEYAKSPLVDIESDPEFQERTKERQAKLKLTEALYPGIWRGRRTKKS